MAFATGAERSLDRRCALAIKQRRSSSLTDLGRASKKDHVKSSYFKHLEQLKHSAESQSRKAVMRLKSEQFDVVDEMMALGNMASQLRKMETVEVSLARLPSTSLEPISSERVSDFPKEDSLSCSLSASHLCQSVTNLPQGNSLSCSLSASIAEAVAVVKQSLSQSVTSCPNEDSLSCTLSDSSAEAVAVELQKGACRASQLEALTALVASMETGCLLSELLFQVSRHVLTRRGSKAFTRVQCTDAMASVLSERDLQLEPTLEDAACRIELVVEALHCHAEDIRLPAEDVIGQILWSHRKSPVFLKKKSLRAVAMDLSWVVMGRLHSSDKLAIDDVFDKITAENELMDSRGWQRVSRLVGQCGALSSLVTQADVNCLWHSRTNTTAPSRKTLTCGINKADFKQLLVAWSQLMKVHPWWIFYTLESHAYNGTTTFEPSDTCRKVPLYSSSRPSTQASNSRSSSLTRSSSSTNSSAHSRPHSASSASRSTSSGSSRPRSASSSVSGASSRSSSPAHSSCGIAWL